MSPAVKEQVGDHPRGNRSQQHAVAIVARATSAPITGHEPITGKPSRVTGRRPHAPQRARHPRAPAQLDRRRTDRANASDRRARRSPHPPRSLRQRAVTPTARDSSAAPTESACHRDARAQKQHLSTNRTDMGSFGSPMSRRGRTSCPPQRRRPACSPLEARRRDPIPRPAAAWTPASRLTSRRAARREYGYDEARSHAAMSRQDDRPERLR